MLKGLHKKEEEGVGIRALFLVWNVFALYCETVQKFDSVTSIEMFLSILEIFINIFYILYKYNILKYY